MAAYIGLARRRTTGTLVLLVAMASASELSPSLERYDAATSSKMQERFAKLHPPTLPETHWQLEPNRGVLYGDDGRPALVTLPVERLLGFFKDNGVMSLMLEFGSDDLWNPTCETGKWFNSIFGVDGTMIQFMADNWKTLVGNKGGPKIPGGKGVDNIRDHLNEDAARTSGKPTMGTVPFKRRLNDDEKPSYKFNMNVYLKEAGGGPDREPGTAPPDVEAGFKNAPGHPVLEFFHNNPEETPKAFAASVASGTSTCWEILGHLSTKGQKQWYMDAVAQLTLGGISVRWNKDRGIFTCSFYLNGPGARIFNGIDRSRGDAIVCDPRDADVYADIAGVKRPSPVDDVYNEAEEKRAKVEDPGMEDA